MHKRLARRVRPGSSRGPEQPVSPTPETRAKLRRDVIERLFKEGRLEEEHVRAAREIRRVWEGIGRSLFPSGATFGSPRQPHLRRAAREPMQRMSDVEEIIWRRRYRPWADEMSLPIATSTVRVSRLQLVLDVVVDNYGLRQVEAWYRMRHGMGFEYLRSALRRYCELAGWAGDVSVEARPLHAEGAINE